MATCGREAAMERQRTHWFATNRFYLRLPDRLLRALAALLGVVDRLLRGRLPHSTWVRYELDLTTLEHSPDPAVTLSLMDEHIADSLRTHPWHERAQLVTAIRLWDHGLRRAYVWLKDGQPLCMQWLFLREDAELLRRLPQWSGMYPPLAQATGQLENILVLPLGLRRREGSGVPFSYAMYDLARRRGLRRLITHIPEGNVAARRWAARTGWVAYGSIRRYHFNLRWLRNHFFYLHCSLPGAGLQPELAVARRAPRSGLQSSAATMEEATIARTAGQQS